MLLTDSPRRIAEPSSVAVVSVGSHGAGNSWFWDESKVDIDQWIGSRENFNRFKPHMNNGKIDGFRMFDFPNKTNPN